MEISLDCELLGRKSAGPMFTAAGEDLLDYTSRILGLHDEALLSLTKTPLVGRLALGLTEDTACTDLARILGRFRRLHPNVSVRTKGRMSLVLRAMLERGELDAAIIQVFSHEVHPADVVLYREDLNWVKHPDLSLPLEGAIPFCHSMTSASTVSGRSTSAKMMRFSRPSSSVRVPPGSFRPSTRPWVWRC